MFRHVNYRIFWVGLVLLWPLSSGWAVKPRKIKERPPRIAGIQYRWCQPLTAKQRKRRAKFGVTFNREVSREEGERRYGSRVGKWQFWDGQGRKIAEGECQAPPPLREAQEHGKWRYWDLQGRRIEMQWKYGLFHGNWILFDAKGQKRWHFEIWPEEPRKEIYADDAYLESEGLLKSFSRNPSRKDLHD